MLKILWALVLVSYSSPTKLLLKTNHRLDVLIRQEGLLPGNDESHPPEWLLNQLDPRLTSGDPSRTPQSAVRI